jgi:hypothetical protein
MYSSVLTRCRTCTAGIMLSKGKLPMVPTFVVLSCGYLLASRKEVDSVELPYLNRARLAYTATKFLGSGGCWRHSSYQDHGYWLAVDVTQTHGICAQVHAVQS